MKTWMNTVAGAVLLGGAAAASPSSAGLSIEDRAHLMDICVVMTEIEGCQAANAASERLRGAARDVCEKGGRDLRHNVTSLDLLRAAEIGQKDDLTPSDVAQFVRLVCN